MASVKRHTGQSELDELVKLWHQGKQPMSVKATSLQSLEQMYQRFSISATTQGLGLRVVKDVTTLTLHVSVRDP